MSIDINGVCAYCDLLIIFRTSILVTRINLEFVFAIEANGICEDNLDYCGYTHNGFQFYKSYYGMIIKKKFQKFEIAHCINILLLQKYSDILSDLMPIEEAFIACVYSIMSIIKWRSNSFNFSALYYQIQDHTIVLP